MKKLRGKKRQFNALTHRLKEMTATYPQALTNDMHVWKLPTSQRFMERLKPKECAEVQRMMEHCAINLMNEKYKVAMLIFPQNMWYSQLLVFRDEAVEHEFIDRQITTGNWQRTECNDIHSKWNVQQFNDGVQNILLYSEVNVS